MDQKYAHTRFRCPRPPKPFPRTFAIVTAHNPNGEDQAENLNVAAHSRLKERIQQLGHACFPITGGSPDFSHVEPGCGILMPSLKEARQLADEFDQEAFFWVRDREVILVSTSGDEQQSLGRWESLVEIHPRPGDI